MKSSSIFVAIGGLMNNATTQQNPLLDSADTERSTLAPKGQPTQEETIRPGSSPPLATASIRARGAICVEELAMATLVLLCVHTWYVLCIR